jgi:hypothetical protein
MNGWTKIFTDGTTEYGSDLDVLTKKASWSRGKLDNVTAVSVQQDKYRIAISGQGEYWQSDDLEVVLGEIVPTYVVRRIQKRIRPSDYEIVPLITKHSIMLKVLNVIEEDYYPKIGKIAIPSSEWDRWLTVELYLDAYMVNWYFARERI